MRKLITGLVLLALPLVAQAQEMPRYDVENHCERVASVGGDFSNMVYNGCIDMEQAAYNGLRGSWGSIPARTRSHCDRVASVGGSGSYSTLQGCVDMEMSASESRSQFSYD